MSNSLRLHVLQPARLLCPQDSPGKNTEVGCHALLQGVCMKINVKKYIHLHTHVHIRWREGFLEIGCYYRMFQRGRIEDADESRDNYSSQILGQTRVDGIQCTYPGAVRIGMYQSFLQEESRRIRSPSWKGLSVWWWDCEEILSRKCPFSQ